MRSALGTKKIETKPCIVPNYWQQVDGELWEKCPGESRRGNFFCARQGSRDALSERLLAGHNPTGAFHSKI
jgi:hypothetical protein